jgi:hypothetical protein
MTTTIKADPDYYVLSLEELDNGQVVLSRHPVIAFQVVPYDDDDERRYETRPITVNGGPPFDKQTLWTPMVWSMNIDALHAMWRHTLIASRSAMETSLRSTSVFPLGIVECN